MSRTYRTKALAIDCNCGADIYHWDKYNYKRQGMSPMRVCHCSYIMYDYFGTKYNYKRDRKFNNKPPKAFKKIYKNIRKAKIRSAMNKAWAYHDYDRYDSLPKFSKEDRWHWN